MSAASGEAQPPGLPDTDDSDATKKAEKPASNWVDSLIGLLVWIVIGLVIAFFYLRGDSVDVFLDVSRPKALNADGAVLHKGAPVANGSVHIVVHGAKSKRYLGGAILPLDAQGRFHLQGLDLYADDDPDETLRVTARFSGVMVKPDKESMEISGEERAYLNFSPPWGPLSVAVLGGTLAFGLFLIFLFTGSLSRTKGRILFGTMYFLTFLSLVVPIGVTLWISQNYYVKDLMEGAPIGLVQGKAPGASGEQWLINIGGVVPRKARSEAAAKATRALDATAAPSPDQSADAPASDQDAPRGATSKDERKAAGAPTLAAVSALQPPASNVIQGGLTVPFYVVLLAMFGAGINMTRKVPEIQKGYDLSSLPDTHGTSLLASPLKATARLFESRPEAADPDQAAIKTTFGIREELIRNYMYLMSAPFLAIAIYYLLQVIATQVSQPVLVVMAFVTGLSSELIVAAILEFADKTLASIHRKRDERKAGEDVRARLVAATHAHPTSAAAVQATKPAAAPAADPQRDP